MIKFAFPTPNPPDLGFRLFCCITADCQIGHSRRITTSAGFAQHRNTILNNLRDAPPNIQELLKKRGGASIVLCEATLPQLRRAETFTLEGWALLVNAIG